MTTIIMHREPLRDASDASDAPGITYFTGKYFFLHNSYPHPIKYSYTSLSAPNLSEALAMQIHPSLYPLHTHYKKQGLPRRVWQKYTTPALYLVCLKNLLQVKFGRPQKSGQEDLRPLLLQTKNKHLQYRNLWGDTFLGVSYSFPTTQAQTPPEDPDQIHGKNHLGKLLMQIRSELR